MAAESAPARAATREEPEGEAGREGATVPRWPEGTAGGPGQRAGGDGGRGGARGAAPDGGGVRGGARGVPDVHLPGPGRLRRQGAPSVPLLGGLCTPRPRREAGEREPCSFVVE